MEENEAAVVLGAGLVGDIFVRGIDSSLDTIQEITVFEGWWRFNLGGNFGAVSCEWYRRWSNCESLR